jgi:hypothetical protein
LIIEVISILAILTGGAAIINASGLRGLPLLYLGFITGLSIYIVIGTVQVITGLSTSPIITLTLTTLLPVGWWLYCKKKIHVLNIKFRSILLSLFLIVLLVGFIRHIELTTVTPDSFYYLTISSLLNSGNMTSVQPFTLLTRMLAVPLMHAPASLVNEFFLPSITPILAISTALSLTWFCQEGLRYELKDLRIVRAFAIAGLCLLLTNNRFVFHTFYINGHLLNAALLVFITGSAWLLISQAEISRKSLYIMIFCAIPALVVTRPEASIFAVLAIMPLLLSCKVPLKHRVILMAALGFSIIAWHGFLWSEYVRANIDLEPSVMWMFLVGFALIIFTPILAWRKIEKIAPNHILTALEIGLWLALTLAAIREPRILYRSVFATIENVLFNAGGWGVSLIILGALVLIVLLITNATNRIFLRYPLTTFVPLSLLLAYLRGGAYRVGHGDSLNRMLFHFVPLAILFISSAAASKNWGLPEWLSNGINSLKIRFKQTKSCNTDYDLN